jgi:hypothetical protein
MHKKVKKLKFVEVRKLEKKNSVTISISENLQNFDSNVDFINQINSLTVLTKVVYLTFECF